MAAVPWDLLLALIAMTQLCLVLRMVFRGDKRRGRREYGLLREVATASSQRAATTVTTRLRENGVRVTTVPAEDGTGVRIMVFPADEYRAVTLLLEDGWPPEDEDTAV
ncbi:MAG: hypothetical protein ACRDQ5_11555 [Sciscionella sp.]